MPTRAQMILPPPTNEYEFEAITRDYCANKYGHAEKHGRRGQAQHGIDIYSQISGKKLITAQCKCYLDLSTNDIDDIIKKSKEFPSEVNKFIIATTAKRNSAIQEYVIAKHKENEMDIVLLYWEEISNFLKKHPEILKLHYPNEVYQLYKCENDNALNITEEYLKNKFNDSIQRFNVIQFLRADVGLGIPYELPFDIDDFFNKMIALLEQAILLQNTNTYTNIMSFTNKIQELNGYRAKILYPTGAGGNYTMQNRYDIMEFEKIQNNEILFKTEINKLYGKINIGMSLF